MSAALKLAEPMKPPPPRFFDDAEEYSPQEVASRCRVSNKLAAKWIDEGILPGRRLPCSRIRRVLHADLIAFMLANGMGHWVEGGRVKKP